MSHAASPHAARSKTPSGGHGHARGARRRRGAGRGVPLAGGASYGGHPLPVLVRTHSGLGLGFMPTTLTAAHGVAAEQSGVDSSILDTARQIGAALGVAVLSTVATTASAGRLPQATSWLRQ